MFPELSLCVNGQESKYSFSVNAYKSEYSKIEESGNNYESGKISFSVNLVLDADQISRYGNFFEAILDIC